VRQNNSKEHEIKKKVRKKILQDDRAHIALERKTQLKASGEGPTHCSHRNSSPAVTAFHFYPSPF